ncbi:SGNH/GDSL hydrolase family protein [Nocardioides abyssi]|uniref:SGNH/GDSL hydrolase family protein n=1 Tax=Nocardioides abyssi TaxID=3058370 RepID=A0ABT8ESF6_9ACTN|nr:SGNH/GDSL hydrolase family protein [Nocardioides abyssi]MDN4160946.1 SGNH/GDSL hydrolase family protein [Nocardioides abyssi]
MTRPTTAAATAAAGLALLAGTLVASPATASAATAPPRADAVEYVALGDSYASAAGVQPVDPAAPVECQRSTRNYARVIAARTGATLVDVTCGGAQTRDLRTAQHPAVAPQLDALAATTELVTVTIGGNDNNVFGGAIRDCSLAGFSTGGTGSPCADQHGSAYEDTVRDETYPALVQAFTDIRERAPQATVAALAYPWILPATGACFGAMPVAEGDVPYLRSLQATLNDAVRRAAEATGATYVDMAPASEGHDACQPAGTRWIEPVFGGTNPVVVHPNAFGEQRMAEVALRTLGLATQPDETRGDKVLRRFDGLAAHQQLPAARARTLRTQVRAIVRYAGLGLDSDARTRLALLRERATTLKRAGKVSAQQARALKRFTRRAATLLDL